MWWPDRRLEKYLPFRRSGEGGQALIPGDLREKGAEGRGGRRSLFRAI
jgi:hypothetical protein